MKHAIATLGCRVAEFAQTSGQPVRLLFANEQNRSHKMWRAAQWTGAAAENLRAI
jgi:hypothetical protein